MAIDFSNAKLLSLNRRNEFFGEAFRYASKADLSIEGCIYALDNEEGVAPIWTGMSGFIASADDYDAIMLNGTNFGSGRVNSLVFKEGNDVRLKEYTASLTVYDTGNLFNLTGTYYSGLNFFTSNNNPIHLTDGFSENFEFNIKDDGSYAYKQTVNVKFISGKPGAAPASPLTMSPQINMAKSLASGLLSSQVPFGFLDSVHSGWYAQSGRRTYTENYNLITNECSFSENFELDYPSGNYSIKYNHEITTEQNGVTNITENGRIKGLYVPYAGNAETGYVFEAGQAYDRCTGVMGFYVPSGYPLAAAHVTSNKKINTILGEIEYGITFTNDPRFNINYIWEYTEQLDREPNTCFYKVSENGHIRGRDNNCTYSQKNQNAIDAYNIIKTGIAQRLSGYYQSGTTLTNPLKLISSNKRHNPYTADIDYSATYADNLYYGISSGVKKIDYEIEDNQPVVKYNKFGIINAKEIAQPTNIYTPGTYTCIVKVQGERGAGLGDLISAGLAIITGNVPTGIHYLDKASYTYAPNQTLFNLNISWQYFLRN